MKVGLCQIDIEWLNISVNFRKIENFIKEGKKKNCDLLIFPEMCLTGFSMNVESLPDNEEEIINIISKLAVTNEIAIALGYGVRVGNKGENKFVIISNKGEIILRYRKIHPFSMASEDKYFIRGKSIEYCNISDFIFSSFICYDLRFPYLFQSASNKAQCIIVAASWPKSRREHWITLLKARAIENQCYIIAVNRVGSGDNIEYSGDSMVIDPNGEEIINLGNKEKLGVCNIDIQCVNRIRNDFNIKKDSLFLDNFIQI